MKLGTLLIMSGAAVFAIACEHNATSAKEASAQPMMEMAAVDQAPRNSSTIYIGVVDEEPKFTGSSNVVCQPPPGQCGQSGGVSTTGISGDIDLTGFTDGDVLVSVAFGDDAWNAGYRFPSDPYQAVAIAIYPQGATTAPDPVFGQAYWPSEFDAPTVSSDMRTVTFIDKDDDDQAYEYSIGVNGPGGRVVLDPKITNKGRDK